MSGKSNIDIFNNMSEEELDIAIKEYNGNYRYYQRLIAMKLVSIGFSFSKVGRILCVSYLSVHRWAKACEESGLTGLVPAFGGGRPSKMSKSMEKKLSNRIESEDNVTMIRVQEILKNEFKIEFTLPHVCNIVRRLGFDYVKPKDEDEGLTLRKVVLKTK